jgi:hypothetical protein
VCIEPPDKETHLSGSEQQSTRRAAMGIFLLLVGIYSLTAGGHTYSSDEEGILATTRALVERRSVVLVLTDDNVGVVPIRTGRTGESVGASGIGQSLVAVPLYLAGSLVSTTVADSYVDFTERVFVGWTNPVLTALGAVFFFLLADLLGARRLWAVALTLTYGLATMAWPHSKTFFSEPLATTMTLGATYFAIRAVTTDRHRDAAWSGALAGMALLGRISAGLFAPLIFVYLLARTMRSDRANLGRAVKAGLAFGAGSAIPMAVLLASNWWRFGSPLDLGYTSVPLNFPVLEGMYGLFLSPGKSLFLYAPAALVGLWAVPFTPRGRRLEVALLVSLGMANALFFARFIQWHGDHSWGPRYLIMTLPFLILPVAPLLDRFRWRIMLGGAAGLGVISAFLGTAMYFNQYFYIAERGIGLQILPDGPSYWRDMHFDPKWSPVVGHLKAMPDVVANSFARLDGEDEALQPLPSRTNDRYGWYFAPAQLDSWVYWLFPAHGPKKLLLFAPVFAGTALLGGVVLARSLSSPSVAGVRE